MSASAPDPIRIVPVHGAGELARPAHGAAPAADPQLTYRGGALLTAVEVFTVFWGPWWQGSGGTALAAQLNGFFDFVLTSGLIDQLGEYDVTGQTIGHGSRVGTTTIAQPALGTSISDAQIQAALGELVAAGTLPSPTANTLYFVYLPPDVSPDLRYPAIYLLHGLRGSPYSFVGGLRLAAVADTLIHAHRVHPFIAVMPPAGHSVQFDGEWTGTWERYVVGDVLPWSERHLPLSAGPAARALAGFSAGAYGAVDMGLRHPGMFGTLESWSGYFKAPRDGSLATATASERAAHDPRALLPAASPELRAAGVRFFLSAGRHEPKTLLATRAFARLLSDLGLEHVLHVTAGGHHGRTWRAVLPAGLLYAFAR